MRISTCKSLWLAVNVMLCLAVQYPEGLSFESSQFDNVLACPRCRRAEPPGPRRLPNEGEDSFSFTV